VTTSHHLQPDEDGGHSKEDMHLSSIVSRAIDGFWERRGMTAAVPNNPYRNKQQNEEIKNERSKRV